MDTFDSTAHLKREVGDELFTILIDPANTGEVRIFLENLQKRNMDTTIFVVSKFFTKRSAKVKFVWFGDDFQKWFVPLRERIVGEPVLPVFHHDLSESSLDAEIFEVLGGRDNVEKHPSTMLGISRLIEKQANGEAGDLLVNGWANIFYVYDFGGVLRAVYVRWYDGGWYVRAYSVDDSGGWDAGDRVFSGNSKA